MNGWEHLAWQVVTMLLGVASAVAVAVITAAVYKYFGLKLNNEQQDALRGYADQAIDYAEQMAAKSAIDKSDKKQVALQYLLEMVERSKIPDIAAERGSKLIEARLGMQNSFTPTSTEKAIMDKLEILAPGPIPGMKG